MHRLARNALGLLAALASLWLPGSPANAQATLSRWTSITSDPRQYAAQPGGVMPLVVLGAPSFAPGPYMVYVGSSNPDGRTVSRWNSFGPFNLQGTDKWAAYLLPQSQLRLERNSAALLPYSNPGPTGAMIYARNNDTSSWQAICVLPIGMNVQPDCFGGSGNVVLDVKGTGGGTDGTYIGRVTAEPDAQTATPGEVPPAEGWNSYANARFGTAIEYPANLFRMLPPPENDDGRKFVARHGEAEFAVFGSHNIFEKTIAELMDDDVAAATDDRVTYRRKGEDWYVLSGYRGDRVFYRKVILSEGGGVIHTFEITYPKAAKAIFDAITARMAKSLQASSAATTAEEGAGPATPNVPDVTTLTESEAAIERPEPGKTVDEPALTAEASGLSEEQALAIAIGILKGDPYGNTETEVASHITEAKMITAGTACGEKVRSPVWHFHVFVPKEDMPIGDSPIDGYLVIDGRSGKLLCAGLPFLDMTEEEEADVTTRETETPADQVSEVESEAEPESTTLAKSPDAGVSTSAQPVGPVQKTELGNIAAVENGPRKAVILSLGTPRFYRTIRTYHWNHGRGSKPGTISLGDSEGRVFGPWQARGEPGQGGVPNAYWVVDVNQRLEPGRYTLVTSNNKTWSTNEGTGWRGFFSAEWQALPAETPEGEVANNGEQSSTTPTNKDQPSAAARNTGETEPSESVATNSGPPTDEVPGVLFAGAPGQDWLPQAYVGGDFTQFGRFEADALIVDVPAGHGWGTTGIYSTKPLVPVPLPDAKQSQRLRFHMDPNSTTGAIFALVPPAAAGREDWHVHDLRLGYIEPAGGPAALVLWTRQQEQGRFAVTDRAVLADLSLVLRPDGIVLVTDAEGRTLIQGAIPDVTPGTAWHVYAEASAAIWEQAVKMHLTEIRLDTPAFTPEPDPAAPLEAEQTVKLFDGNVIPQRFMRFSAHGGDFARHARLEGGALVVDVPKGQGWGKAGLATSDAVLWLDRFTEGASARLSFEFDAGRTTGFVLALSTYSSLNGNDPGNPRFYLHWRKGADGIVRASRGFDQDTARLDVETPEGMPAKVDFVLTPAGLQVQAPGFPNDIMPWSELVEGQGFRIYAYSNPDGGGLPVSMVLKRITLTRIPGEEDPPPDLPMPGVDPLPETTLFNAAPGPVWTPFSLTTAGTFDQLAKYQDDWLVADVPAVNGWARVGLLSTDPILRFDSRIQRTSYRLRLKLDPARTDGFSAIFSTAKAEDVWGARAPYVDLVRQTKGRNAGKYRFTLNQGPYGNWTRMIDPAWIVGHWDGTVEIEFGKGWVRARLPGGVSLRGGGFPVGVDTNFYMVVHSVGTDNHAPAKLALGRITGGWVTPPGMSAFDRWHYLAEEEFDPEAYLDDLAVEAPWPSPK